nr:NAD(P)-binding domain-containing protein [Nocardia cyriacigeorgica]
MVIAASGMFGNPHRPNIPALNTYTGKVMHSADYRPSEAFAGQRVVVIGSGNSAFQIAVELASHAEVILASRTCCGMRPPSRFRLIPGSGVTASLTNR